MLLRLTLADPDRAVAAVDVEVAVAAGTPLADVRDALLATAGAAAARSALYAGAGPVPDTAVLGLPPLLDGTVLTVGREAADAEPPGLLELHVTGGPDAGQVVRLGPGEHPVGRAVGSTVRVEDLDVSRLHAVVAVTAGGATVRDAGSTNGTDLDGAAVGTGPIPLPTGAELRVGDSTLVLRMPGATPASAAPDGTGGIAVNRSPRMLPVPAETEVRFPEPPPVRALPRFPLAAMAAPLAMAGLLYLVLPSNPASVVMALFSPVMLVSNVVTDRMGGKRSNAALRAAFTADTAAATERLTAVLAAERRDRQSAAPDPAAVLGIATGPLARLWERRRDDPDLLCVRVGTGRLPARVRVSGPLPATAPAGPETEPAAGVGIDAVPVTLALREVGVLGVAGPREQQLAIARWLVGQVAVLHSPRDVEVTVLTAAGPADWQWVGWLPHVAPCWGQDCRALVGLDRDQVVARVAELTALLDARREAVQGSFGGWRGRWSLVVLDGARALRSVPGVARLLADGPAHGLAFVCLDDAEAHLPTECSAVVAVAGETGSRLRVDVDGGRRHEDVVADLVAERWAQRVGRALAPMRDATPDGDDAALPAAARLLDVLPFDATDPVALAAVWRARPRSTTAVLGAAADGPFAVDLRLDGPHALVAGTTGSGKSELLQTLVASLAVANRPDELCFVLVDYKGGSAFKDCARLPHTVGLVTDLDGHLTERALASLGAELRRREHLLRDAGAKDLEDYQRDAPAGAAALARLVIVIDEFATLVEELPDFVGGLVGIAQRGRSLGVHLVLATQRPGGVVSADIRANTNLRIALRVTDAGESVDVVDVGDAALIPRSAPGRGYVRTGSAPAVAFQSGRVGGRPELAGTAGASVLPVPWAAAGLPRPRAASADDAAGPTDLSRLVDAARTAATQVGARPAPSPWLPPLPAVLTLDELPPGDRWQLPVGLRDLPAEQRHDLLAFDLAHGDDVLVTGGPRSGRSSALRAVAASVARRFAPTDVHLFAIDCGGSALLPLAALPHCGAAVSRDQTARGDRLLTRLLDEVGRRQRQFATAGFASLAEQRDAVADADALPYLVLLLDSWEGFVTAYEEVDHGRPVDTLLRLLREGGAAGVRVYLSGDRATLSGRLAAAVSDRLLLRLADPSDAALAGVPLRSVPANQPPGRAVVPDGVVEAQLALLDRDSAGVAQQAAMAALVASVRPLPADVPAHQRPMRVDALPDTVALADLSSRCDGGPLTALLGVGGDELAPAAVDLDADGPGFVVTGPPGSGRSTALATMARSLIVRGTPVVLVAGRRSALRAVEGEPGVLGVLGADDAGTLSSLVAAIDGPLVVFADDAESLLGSPIESVLTDLLRRRDDAPRAVVVAGATTELAVMFRGVAVEAKKSRTGLVLMAAGPNDGDPVGARVSRADEMRPGRGALVVRGQVLPVQVAR